MLQSMKGLPTEIKAQIGGFWLFGGFNRQQFRYMVTQISFPFDKEIVWKISFTFSMLRMKLKCLSSMSMEGRLEYLLKTKSILWMPEDPWSE